MPQKVSFPAILGGQGMGEIALPEREDKAPAVVLLHEWWGLNDHVRATMERLAEAGFVALALDLYHGKVTDDPSEASQLIHALDWSRALLEISGAVYYFLAEHERVNGKIGAVGFSMGGAFCFSAAATIPRLAAAVPFYGIPGQATDYTRVKAPILAHFAARDTWAKPALARAIQKELTACGQPMELHVYDADHAFMNDTRPEAYHPQAAHLAWARTIEFLRRHLGSAE
ncbi:dienelactone hydrolase family protein [Sorangium atrum]|uniref:Dienelactone hydrolase family protein n=1 Tax=Sorangium atrum TaxID=2995308 RepID=A0ABT5CGW6_9BACT|nr:dienelactone hydrolase family protein [Sorangium aterium]MDC0685680.1 dienelactone hydrolase family protein [Sorangium aterium]